MDYLKAPIIFPNLLPLLKEHHDYGQAYGWGTDKCSQTQFQYCIKD